MTDIHIPPEALEAGARELLRECNLQSVIVCRDAARAAFLAMIENWPFKQFHSHHVVAAGGYGPGALILPLTEQTDDKA